jgi:hypothetical protein
MAVLEPVLVIRASDSQPVLTVGVAAEPTISPSDFSVWGSLRIVIKSSLNGTLQKRRFGFNELRPLTFAWNSTQTVLSPKFSIDHQLPWTAKSRQQCRDNNAGTTMQGQAEFASAYGRFTSHWDCFLGFSGEVDAPTHCLSPISVPRYGGKTGTLEMRSSTYVKQSA